MDRVSFMFVLHLSQFGYIWVRYSTGICRIQVISSISRHSSHANIRSGKYGFKSKRVALILVLGRVCMGLGSNLGSLISGVELGLGTNWVSSFQVLSQVVQIGSVFQG